MSGAFSRPAIEGDLAEPSKLSISIDPPDHFDPKTNDLSFADSFFDFGSMEEWFEDIHATTTDVNSVDVGRFDLGAFEMADEGNEVVVENPERVGVAGGKIFDELLVTASELIVDGSGVEMKVVEAEECKNLGELSCSIEKDFEKVSLAGESESCDFVARNEVKAEMVCNDVEDSAKVSGPETAITSSSASSSESSEESESTSSSSSEESDSDDDHVKVKKVKKVDAEIEEGEILEADGKQTVSREDDEDEEEDDVDNMATWSDPDEEDEGGGEAKPIRSRNELADLPPVPPVDVKLQPNHQLLPVGVVLSILDAKVIVEGVEKHNPLCEGSILWITEHRSPLGLIDEIFGPVKNPYYVVRYNSETEVPAGLQEGSVISFVPEFVNHVLDDKSLYKKGYDASGDNDEELSDEAEFSDDEKEAEFKRMQKMSKRGLNDQNIGNDKRNKKKGTNRDRQWKNNKPEAHQPTMGKSQLPPNQNRYNKPPHADGNSSSISVGSSISIGHLAVGAATVPSFPQNGPAGGAVTVPSFPQNGPSGGAGTVPSFPQNGPAGGAVTVPSFPQNGPSGGAGTVPSFPQTGPAGGFPQIPNGLWNNGMQYQQQGNVFPGGLPAQGMQWLLQNLLQNAYQMQFQQQFDPNQRPVSFPPGGQQSFFPGSAPAPWTGFVGMGTQGQQLPPSANPGQMTMPNGMQMEQNRNFQSPTSSNPGNVEAPQQFNQGATYGPGRGRGRRQYQRGGGRFSGGRGRHQSR